MTLEEVIKNFEEIVKTNERICATEFSVGLPDIYIHKDEAKKCADEYRQLAKWLKELKQYREWLESFNSDSATDCFTAVRNLRSVVKV